MPKRKVVSETDGRYAICLIYSNGDVGWLLGGGERGLDVKTYPTKDAASKSLAQMKKGFHYSWNVSAEIREYSD